MSIRTRLTLLTTIPLAAALVLSAGFWVSVLLQEAEISWQDLHAGSAWTTRARRSLAERNRAIVSALAPVAQRLRDDLRLLAAKVGPAGCLDAHGVPSVPCRHVLEGSLEWSRDVEGLAVQRGSHVVAVAGRPVPPPTLTAVRSHVRELPDEATLHPLEVAGRVLLATVHRLQGGDERLVAWGQSEHVLKPVELLRHDGPHRVGFANDAGRLLAPLPVARGSAHSLDVEALAADIRGGRELAGALVFAFGAPLGLAVQRVPGTGLRVVTVMPLRGGVTARIRTALWQYLALGAAGLGLAGAGAWMSTRGLARRLGSLTVAVRRVGGGQLDTAIPVSGKDEIGRLGVTLAAAMGRLRDAYDNLEQKVVGRGRDLAARDEELRHARALLARHTPGAANGPRDTPALDGAAGADSVEGVEGQER